MNKKRLHHQNVSRIAPALKRALLLGAGLFFSSFAFADETILSDSFSYPNGLITNEYAFWNPQNASSIKSSIWDMTSGSLFASGGAGWTGVPDNRAPGTTSSTGNNSCVFRMNTKRTDFENVAVSLSLLNQGVSSTSSTPPVSWDGLHIWLRYKSETNLYYASINRRDNTVVIKKKVPGGPSNGGTYYVLGSIVPNTVRYNVWQQVKATVQTNSNGSVTIKLYEGNTLLVSATDNGTIGGPPIIGGGRIGIRGDNANLKFDNLSVTSLSAQPVPPPTPGFTTLTAVQVNQNSVKISWPKFTSGSQHFFKAGISMVSSAGPFSPVPLTGVRMVGNQMEADILGLEPQTLYHVVLYHSENLTTWSQPSSVLTVRPGTPLVPTNVVATPGDSQVTISWSSVPGATSYNLYRSRTGGVNKTNGYQILNVVSPKLNTSFINGTPYYMVVTAVNAAGESLESVQVSAVPSQSANASSLMAAAPDLSSTRIFPNPWKANQHNGTPITFGNLTSHATVKIFTLAGSLVTTLQTDSSSLTWPLTNTSGEKVASGLYLYLITNDQNQKSRGTVAVIQ